MHIPLPHKENIAAGVTLAALAYFLIYANIRTYAPKYRALEAARRAALTEEQRDEEDFEDWANKNSW